MITQKEKAKELFYKFYPIATSYSLDRKNQKENAKQCALITVNEMLDLDCFDMSEEHFENHINYYEEVKQEIEKL
jgi:hypothetical protein